MDLENEIWYLPITDSNLNQRDATYPHAIAIRLPRLLGTLLSQMAVQNRRCGQCKKPLPCDATHFKPIFGRSGIEFSKTCRGCAEKSRVAQQQVRAKDKVEKGNGRVISQGDNAAAMSRDDADDASDFCGVTEISLDAFLVALSARKSVHYPFRWVRNCHANP